MSRTYTHLFFDLDRTLWDFERNSEITLEQLFREFQLQPYFGSFILFKDRYEYHNQKLWVAYHQNRITKEKLVYHRFYLCLKEAGIDDIDMAKEMGIAYLEWSPLQTQTFPYTHETLDYLKGKGYNIHIITNGFNEVQYRKLKNCRLSPFISTVITSEDAGQTKPHPDIFSFAMEQTGARIEESLMIGDDLKTDIEGARNFGMDQVFFNPRQVKSTDTASYEIKNLSELKKIL